MLPTQGLPLQRACSSCILTSMLLLPVHTTCPLICGQVGRRERVSNACTVVPAAHTPQVHRALPRYQQQL